MSVSVMLEGLTKNLPQLSPTMMVCQVKVCQSVWMCQVVWPMMCQLPEFVWKYKISFTLQCMQAKLDFFIDGVSVVELIVMISPSECLYFHAEYVISFHACVLMYNNLVYMIVQHAVTAICGSTRPFEKIIYNMIFDSVHLPICSCMLYEHRY